MNVKEFQAMIGGKYAVVMVCQVDGATHNGHTYKKGGEINCVLATGLALYKQTYNGPNGEARKWLPKGTLFVESEVKTMNAHFERQFKKESSEEAIQIGDFKGF